MKSFFQSNKYLLVLLLFLIVLLAFLVYYVNNHRTKKVSLTNNKSSNITNLLPLTSKTVELNKTSDDFLWGIYVNGPSFEKQILLAARLGVSYIRMPWVNEEGMTREKIFAIHDSQIKTVSDNGMKVYVAIEPNYNFSSTDNAYQLGYDYLSEISKHYKNKIGIYQIGNEVSAFCLKGSEYSGEEKNHYDWQKCQKTIEWLKGASDGIRKNDSKSKILINGNWLNVAFFDKLAEEKIDYDILGWDWYSDMGFMGERKLENGTYLINKLKSFNKPIYLVEINYRPEGERGQAGQPEEKQAEFIEKMAKWSLENGLRGFFVFGLMDIPKKDYVDYYGIVPVRKDKNDASLNYPDYPRKAYYSYLKLIENQTGNKTDLSNFTINKEIGDLKITNIFKASDQTDWHEFNYFWHDGFGYSLRLPEEWQDWKVKERKLDENTTYLEFILPTKDNRYNGEFSVMCLVLKKDQKNISQFYNSIVIDPYTETGVKGYWVEDRNNHDIPLYVKFPTVGYQINGDILPYDLRNIYNQRVKIIKEIKVAERNYSLPEIKETNDWRTYKNDLYGFKITLNDEWKGYVVEEGESNNQTKITFWVPTKEEQVITSKPGYYWTIQIGIYPKERWLVDGKYERNGYLTKNDNYVFAANYVSGIGNMEELPKDIANKNFDFINVLKSFRSY